MPEKNESLIEYYPKIEDIPITKIEVNEFNPRKKFVEIEEDELIESILAKGILNPIIVYKKPKNGTYVLLDGERRYRACQKLNIKTIPAHVLMKQPSLLENISMMFHIHNVREEWTDFAISISLKKVVEELGKNVRTLKTADINELKKITSLSEYKLRKYLRFQDYPNDVVEIFLNSEMKEKPDKGVDPDILSEMHRPIKEIKKQMPDLLKTHPINKIIKACIEKKASNIIETNKEFRLLSKALSASKKGEIRKAVLKEKIIDFVDKKEVTPLNIYEATSQTVYQVKEIIKYSSKLHDDISNLNLNKLKQDELKQIRRELSRLLSLINQKIMTKK